jgi:hypothetical protein
MGLLSLSAVSAALAQGMPMGNPSMDDDLLRFSYSLRSRTMIFQRVSDLLLVTILYLLSSAFLPVLAAEQSNREAVKATHPAPSAPLDPSVPVKHCTVVDSNGPLEGGELTTYGCSEDEFCFCESYAGYSCGGSCRQRDMEGNVNRSSTE